MKTLLLQSVEGIVAQGGMDMVKNVTPYSAVGYAFAVLILCFGVYVFYKLYIDEKKYNKERSQSLTSMTEKVIELMIVVKTRLDDQQSMKDSFGVISNKIDMTIRSVEELKNIIK